MKLLNLVNFAFLHWIASKKLTRVKRNNYAPIFIYFDEEFSSQIDLAFDSEEWNSMDLSVEEIEICASKLAQGYTNAVKDEKLPDADTTALNLYFQSKLSSNSEEFFKQFFTLWSAELLSKPVNQDSGYFLVPLFQTPECGQNESNLDTFESHLTKAREIYQANVVNQLNQSKMVDLLEEILDEELNTNSIFKTYWDNNKNKIGMNGLDKFTHADMVMTALTTNVNGDNLLSTNRKIEVAGIGEIKDPPPLEDL